MFLIHEKGLTCLFRVETGLNKKVFLSISIFNNSSLIGCVCLSLAVITLVTLVLILLWQIYFPGTAYRYWKCRQGHAKPVMTASFEFIPYRDTSKVSNENKFRVSFSSRNHFSPSKNIFCCM